MKLWFMYCITLMTMLLMMGDGRKADFVIIRVGYVITDNNRETFDMAVRSGAFYNEDIRLEAHVYESERVMTDELLDDKIDMAWVDVEKVLLDEKAAGDIKVLLELLTANHMRFGLCVRTETLEEDTALLIDCVSAVHGTCLEHEDMHIMEPDEWMTYYIDHGYDADLIMKYLAPDFLMEVLTM